MVTGAVTELRTIKKADKEGRGKLISSACNYNQFTPTRLILILAR